MASQEEWQARVNDVITARITRGDVRVGARVEIDGDVPLDAFDEGEFGQWLTDWVDYTLATTAGPVMPGTAETEWTIGQNAEVRISLLLTKGG